MTSSLNYILFLECIVFFANLYLNSCQILIQETLEVNICIIDLKTPFHEFYSSKSTGIFFTRNQLFEFKK